MRTSDLIKTVIDGVECSALMTNTLLTLDLVDGVLKYKTTEGQTPKQIPLVTLDSEQVITGIKHIEGASKFRVRYNSSSKEFTINPSSDNTYTDLGFDGTQLRLGSDIIAFTGIKPNSSLDLGTTSNKWNDLYLSGNLSDGTNAINIQGIINKLDKDTTSRNNPVVYSHNAAGTTQGVTEMSPNIVNSALVQRDASGLFLVGTPTANGNPANKKYVDDAIATANFISPSELEQRLASYVTTSALNNTLADYITSTGLAQILNSYVTSTDLTTTLGSYVTTSSLTTTLSGYVTTYSLNTKLDDYVTNTALTQALNSYVKLSDLTTTLGSYVTTSSLTTTLRDYVATSALNNTLADYITETELSTALDSYVTSTNLSTTLGSYVTTSSLTTTLRDYVTTSALNNTLADYITSTGLNQILLNYATSSELTSGLATKQDKLTFDSDPTRGSANPVTSGGVYTAIENAISTTYKYMGSYNVSQINNFDALDMRGGYVYNVENAGTITLGNKNVSVNAGDNIAWVGTPSNGYFDKLAGLIDLSSYVTTSSLNTTLSSYVTSSSLNTTLSSYVTSSSLNTTLSSYVTTSSLTTTLRDYITSIQLDQILSGYATSTDLTTTLSGYVETSTLSSYVTSTDLTTTLRDYITSIQLDQILSGYVTSTDLTTTLGSYVTSSSLSTTLSSYVTSSSLSTTLSSYVTETELSTALDSYVTSSSLSTTLSSYVTSSSLSTTLNSYVTTSSLSNTLSGYVETSTLSSYVTTSSLTTTLRDYITSIQLDQILSGYATSTDLTNGLAGKQDTLVGSGTGQNIKTINGTNILGSGDIAINVITTFNELSGKPKFNASEMSSSTRIYGVTSRGVSGYIIRSNGSGSNPSWTSLKTINGESILGTGDISVSGGGTALYKHTITVTGSNGTGVFVLISTSRNTQSGNEPINMGSVVGVAQAYNNNDGSPLFIGKDSALFAMNGVWAIPMSYNIDSDVVTNV